MHNTLPKKSLGQHWLHDEATLETIVASTALTSQDTVVEIGPGLGTLTQKLVQTGAQVIAIEYDESLLTHLHETFKNSKNFKLIHEDVLRFDFSKLPRDYTIVANIPYYLTSQLLRILSDMPNKPLTAALLMQKEVTQRVCSQPGDMSILSVAVQSVYAVSEGVFVPAAMFTPPPKVDSSLLLLHRNNTPLISAEERSLFMRVVKAGFSAKRKTIRNTLSAGLLLPKNTIESLTTSCGIDFARRAETLTLVEWKSLFFAYIAMKNDAKVQ